MIFVFFSYYLSAVCFCFRVVIHHWVFYVVFFFLTLAGETLLAEKKISFFRKFWFSFLYFYLTKVKSIKSVSAFVCMCTYYEWFAIRREQWNKSDEAELLVVLDRLENISFFIHLFFYKVPYYNNNNSFFFFVGV